MNTFKQIIKTVVISCLALSGSQALAARDLSTSDQTAYIYAVTANWNTDVRIEKVDGRKSKISGKKPTRLDAGEHVLDVRMEYQPAAGSSVLVGSIGNLILRGLTNKTFRTQVSIDMAPDHEYAVYAEKSDGEGFDLVTFNLTEELEMERQRFSVNDGKLERLF